MKTIQISRSDQSVRVDDEDYERLALHRWFLNADGYAVRTRNFRQPDGRKDSRTIAMHREILGTPVGVQTDHINGLRLDNQKGNLRLCTIAQNCRNRGKPRGRMGVASTSRFKGVCWEKGCERWKAQIVVDYRHISIGRFRNEEAAAQAYDSAASRYFGSFAVLNFPNAGQLEDMSHA